MSCNKCHKEPLCNPEEVRTTYIGDAPTVNPNTMPDYFLVESDYEDTSNGNTVRTLQRMPAKRVLGGGLRDNVIAIESNNNALGYVDGQPIPAYVQVDGSVVSVQRAKGSKIPQFFVVGSPAEGLVYIQSTGFIVFTEGHEYIVGAPYYLDTATGEPTTDPTSGIKLFVPISDTTLVVTLEY